MQDKLKLLLNQIQLEEEYHQYFDGGILNKIIGNKNRDNYVFLIDLKSNLPLDVYKKFIQLLPKAFPTVKKVSSEFTSLNINEEYILDYYKYFIDELSLTSPLLGMFKDLRISYTSSLNIIVNNKAEEMKLNSIKKDLETLFKSVGYDIPIETIVSYDEKLSRQIEKELEVKVPIKVVKEEKVIEPKQKFEGRVKKEPLIIGDEDENVIIGRKIEDAITRLDTVYEETNNITIEAKMYCDLDIRETRTDLKIITLKLTDMTDSIYGKIFVNTDEELSTVKKLKKNVWYKIRGSIKNDKYSGELTLTLRDVNKSSRVDAEVIDDAPIKRVELHAHTMMSQMDGITKLDLGKHTCELVEKTISMGYKGVAITDHSGCQAFPISFGIIKSHNKSVIKKLKGKIEELENSLNEENTDVNKEEVLKEIESLKETLKNPPLFKGIYGTELTLVDDTINIVVRPTEADLATSTYVVFDTETTGFNAGGADQMIEIGAVK